MMFDTAYDGEVFDVVLSDVPDRKTVPWPLLVLALSSENERFRG